MKIDYYKDVEWVPVVLIIIGTRFVHNMPINIMTLICIYFWWDLHNFLKIKTAIFWDSF